jgi:hypothetical protein
MNETPRSLADDTLAAAVTAGATGAGAASPRAARDARFDEQDARTIIRRAAPCGMIRQGFGTDCVTASSSGRVKKENSSSSRGDVAFRRTVKSRSFSPMVKAGTNEQLWRAEILPG